MDLKIGVLMGGDSAERKISLKSGEAIYKALKEKGCWAKKIVTSHTLAGTGKSPRQRRGSPRAAVTSHKTDTIKREEIAKQIRKSGIEFAFIAMHGGFGENGGVQSLLEELNISYSGSGVSASQRAMNKILSKQIFQQNKIPTPEYGILKDGFFEKDVDLITKKIGFPLVIKPVSEGSSIGVSIVGGKSDLKEKINLAKQYSANIIVEKYINGREITVGILGEQALPPILLIPKNKFYDYSAKYESGITEYLVPAPLSKQISACAQKTALKAHFALGCSVFSRVDLILDKQNQCFVLEVNTIPGFTETSLLPKAAEVEGISFEELCNRIVESSLDNF